jgi:dTDP-4-dehydrorhamnose reductase
MRILLTGATGQVGYELRRSLQGLGEVFAPDRAGLDLGEPVQVRSFVRALRPGLIVNAAAYTAVDRAESEPGLAWRINADAPAVLASEARALGAAMVHYSTDYVFGGQPGRPWREDDATNPLNAYGRSKLAGEQAVAAAGIAHLILRTSWVYGLRGSNFLLTMLRLAREQGRVRVVSDQFGAPTWSRTVADVTAHMLAQARDRAWWDQNGGLYHLACGGSTSWHGFAQAIMDEAGVACDVQPISTSEYPTPARRPAYSVLDSARLQDRFGAIPEWRDALRLCLREHAAFISRD